MTPNITESLPASRLTTGQKAIVEWVVNQAAVENFEWVTADIQALRAITGLARSGVYFGLKTLVERGVLRRRKDCSSPAKYALGRIEEHRHSPRVARPNRVRLSGRTTISKSNTRFLAGPTMPQRRAFVTDADRITDRLLWMTREMPVPYLAATYGTSVDSIRTISIERGFRRDGSGRVVVAPCKACEEPAHIRDLSHDRLCPTCRPQYTDQPWWQDYQAAKAKHLNQ